MPQTSSGPLRRLPFSFADADEVVAFCVAHGSPHDAALVRRLLVELTSDPAGVLVIADAGGPALAATVIDRAQNGADAAKLEILGVRSHIPAESFSRLVVEPAIAFARSGVRRALHVALHPSLSRVDGAEHALREAGFVPAYDSFVMRRSAGAPAPEAGAPLLPGWRWASLDDAKVEAAHAALAEMFAGDPSFSLSPLSDFRRAAGLRTTVWRLLLDGDRIAGLVQVVQGQACGELRTVGRAPIHRGAGLGARLVTEALRLLQASGRGEIHLEVAARNERALALYRQFGFEVATRTPTFARPLR